MLVEQDALRLLEEGKKGVFTVIVSTEGSTPRDAGAMMVVHEDRTISGTIGGGPMEFAVVNMAEKQVNEQKTKIKVFGMRGTDVETSVSICGGGATVCLHTLEEKDIDGLREICDCLERHENFSMVIKKDGENDAHIECVKGGGVLTDPENGILYAGDPKANERLILIGGGHVALSTAKIAEVAGFDIAVTDDRPEFASTKRFPGADCRVCTDFEHIPFDDVRENDYIVIATTGHKGDRHALEWALKTKAEYVGMLGSRTKVHFVLDYLLEKGITKERIESVHSPVGISLGGRTPGDIGVSIVAEMIMHRASKGEGELKAHAEKKK